MFTGIIQHVCKGYFDGKRLIIENPWRCPKDSSQCIVIGESISVNGACLTVVKVDENLHFDVGVETLNKTNLRFEKYFNLERALRVGDSLSGHYVTGHVDGTTIFLSKQTAKNSVLMTFKKPREHWGIIQKGSIAINGVSLTIAAVSDETFTVQVIPHTLEKTNLKFLVPGSPVNYEIDIFARYMKGVLDIWMRNLYNPSEMTF